MGGFEARACLVNCMFFVGDFWVGGLEKEVYFVGKMKSNHKMEELTKKICK